MIPLRSRSFAGPLPLAFAGLLAACGEAPPPPKAGAPSSLAPPQVALDAKGAKPRLLRYHSVRHRLSVRLPSELGEWKVDDHSFPELVAETGRGDAAITVKVDRFVPAQGAGSYSLCTKIALRDDRAHVAGLLPLREGIAPPAAWTVLSEGRPKNSLGAAGSSWDAYQWVTTELREDTRPNAPQAHSLGGHVVLVAAHDRECLVFHASTTAVVDRSNRTDACVQRLSEQLALLEETALRTLSLDGTATRDDSVPLEESPTQAR